MEPPPCKAAAWSVRLAFFGVLVAALALVLAKTRVIDPFSGLVVISAGWMFAIVALLLAAAASITIWNTGRRGISQVLVGCALATLLLAGPIYFAVQAVRLPVLNDVTTDLADPPDFMRSAKALAARNGQTPGVLDETVREAQRMAYPAVQSILLDLEIEDAWALVLKTAVARGWRISDQILPGGRLRIGHVDAVDRSALLGFPDDITIRLRPLPGQTRIDLRSVSRYGRHDFGANAARILAFASELQLQLEPR